MSGTSNISLREFQMIARLSGDGDIRISRNTQDGEHLVNKGTLGNKIATFFDGIGRAFGAEDTRGERNQGALNGFRQALIDGYGRHGELALQGAGLLVGSHQVLTGTDVLRVLEHAEEMRRGEINSERHRHEDMSLYEDVTWQMGKELSEKNNNRTPDEFFRYETDLRRRVSDRCRFESDLYRNKLTDEQIREFARQEKDSIVKTFGGEQLRVLTVRGDLHRSSESLLNGIDDKGRLTEVLDDIESSLAALNEKGDISLNSEDRIRQYAKAMFSQLMSRQLVDRSGDIDRTRAGQLALLQHEMLQEGSTLQQVHLDGGFNNRREIIEGLVQAMARVLGPISGSPEGDLDRLKAPREGKAPTTDPIKVLDLDGDDLYGKTGELGVDDDSEIVDMDDVLKQDREIIFGNFAEQEELYGELSKDSELQALGVDDKVLSNDDMKNEFWIRFEESCRRISGLETSELDSELVVHIAREEMKRFLSLFDNPGELDKSIDRRRDVELATRSFFNVALDPGYSANDLFQALNNFIGAPEFAPGSSGPTGLAATRFMTETIELLKTTPKDELIEMRDRMLEDGSSVREFYRELSEQVGDQTALAMQRAIEDLVRGLCAGLGQSPDESLEKLSGR